MANISDGYGTITVEKVGHELKEFLSVVQEGAYYLLIDDVDNLNPDSNGDVKFTFGAGGRWSYETNIRGYLEGEWMNGEKEKPAYDKFIKEFKEKNGSLLIEYTDSDTAMDWMGEGVYQMTVIDGEIDFSHNFEEERITLERFAEQNGESTYWALEYIYGDEVSGEYDEYLRQWHENHILVKGSMEPAEPEDWFDNIYESEE